MFGFLNVNKPKGITSRAALDAIEPLVRPIKVGHAGTLDPLASGVLVVCLGPATRLVRFVQQMPKRYIADFRLGWESDTEDIDGTLRPLENPPVVTRQTLSSLLPNFLGQISQRPPRFSALRVKGKRAYDLAREGKSFELKSRFVEVYQLKLLEFAYPDFRLEISCGSGTYVRSLGRDLGEQLGSAAIMTDLARTAVGNFRIAQGVDWSRIQQMKTMTDVASHLIPPQQGLQGDPQRAIVTLNSSQIEDLKFGRRLQFPREPLPPHPSEWLAVDSQGELLAIMQPESADQHKIAVSFMHYWNQ